MLVQRQIPAELVRPCPDEPPLPPGFASDVDQALWLNQAIAAGADCRAAHRKLSDWVKAAPT